MRGETHGQLQIFSTPPTTNKTIRFPNDVVEEVEQVIQGKNCTFSAFVIAAVRAALEDLKQSGAQCVFYCTALPKHLQGCFFQRGAPVKNLLPGMSLRQPATACLPGDVQPGSDFFFLVKGVGALH